MKTRNNLLKFLVGPNGAGKTYKLNKLLSENSEDGLLIDEDGMPNIPRQRNRVSIDFKDMLYFFDDEISRGNNFKREESELILESSQVIVNYCNKIIKRIEKFTNKSKGQEKLLNIMLVLTQYNLNNIKFIYFDEPENYLDEEYLKIVTELLILLKENNFNVMVATHNPRLLNIIKVDIDNIILLKDRREITLTVSDMKEMYKNKSENILAIHKKHKMNQDSGIFAKLNIFKYEKIFDSFIEQILRSECFYRSLFYKQIIIVEGISDVVAIENIKDKLDTSTTIFDANGKVFIPFLSELFLKLGKKVVVIIDEDKTTNKSEQQNASVSITISLQEMQDNKDIKLIMHTPDLEKFYGIDLNKVVSDMNQSNNFFKKNKGWVKYIAAFQFFKYEENKLKLRNHIFSPDEEESLYKLE